MTLRPEICRLPLAFLAMASISLLGCSSWRMETGPPRTTTAEMPRGTVRITRVDGSRTILERSHAVADTVYGLDPDAKRTMPTTLEWQRAETFTRETAVPLDSIRSVETLHYNGQRTGLLVSGILIGLVALIAASLQPVTINF